MDLPTTIDLLPTQFPAYVELHRDVVLNADLWSGAPVIMTADWGFEGIMGIPGVLSAGDLGRASAAGAGVNGDYATLSPTPPMRNLTSGGSPVGLLAGGFGASVAFADAFPIVFSWPLLPSTVSPTDFAITLNTGQVVTPLAAALNPNYDYNERHVVVMLGEFGNRLSPGTPGAVYPVSVSIVADDTPLMAVGPDGLQSLVGQSQVSRNPYEVGPGLVAAKLSRFSSAGDFAPASLSGNSPNDGGTLYGADAVYRLRLYTWGGFSPDGVSPILPTEFARYFRLAATDATGAAVAITQTGVAYDLGAGLGTVTVVGLAELGRAGGGSPLDPAYYTEDHDNYIDVILKGDEAAVRALTSVTIPTSAEAGYSDLYNPGGPGRTPNPAYTYTAPAKVQTIGIDLALDDAGTVSHAAQSVASYDSADGLPVVFRLRNPVTTDTVYTASTKQAASLIAAGYVEQGVPFSNEQVSRTLVGVHGFYAQATGDHVYTADAAEIARLQAAGSGYVDQGVTFTATGTAEPGTGPIYRFHSVSLGEHIYTPSLTEGFTSAGYAYEGVAWHSVVLMPGLTADVVFDRSDDVAFPDTLTGTGTLTKKGAGMLTLTGTNTLSGSTSVEAGTLRVDGDLSASATTVASGATLSGTGTVGALTASGEVSPAGAAATGTLSADGDVTIRAAGTLAVDIAPGSADRLAAAGAAALGGGTLRVTAAGGTYIAGTSYDVLTATGGITGAFATVRVRNPEALAGLVLNATNAGSAIRLSLGTEAALTAAPDRVTYVGAAVTGGIPGLGADDAVAFVGRGNTLSGDVSGGGGLTIGSDDGTATTLTLGSGTQVFTSVATESAAALTVNARLEASALVNGGTLGGDGTVAGTVVNTGIVAPGNSPGVLTVEGSLTNLGSASSLVIEIDGATAGSGDGHHDQVAVTGTPGTFIADGALVPVLRGFAEADASPYTPVLGQSFTIVTATGGVGGAFSSLTQPAEGLPTGTRFDTLYGTDAIRLVVTPQTYAALDGLSANRTAAAGVVDAIRPAAGTLTGTDTDSLFAALYGTGASELAAALGQLSGEIHADALAASLGTARLFGDAMLDRGATAHRHGIGTGMAPLTAFSLSAGDRGAAAAAAPAAAPDAAGDGATAAGTTGAVWARAVGRFATIDGDGNGGGSDATTGGFLFGVDGAVEGGTRIGVGFGYLDTGVDSNAHLGSVDMRGYAVGLHASRAMGDGFVAGALSYVFSDQDSRRAIRFGGIDRTASGSGQGHALGAALTAGHAFAADGVVIEPTAGIRYDRVLRTGFTETGAGTLGLSLDDDTLEALRTSLGLRVATGFTLGAASVEAEVRARWDHDVLDASADSRASLAGTAFTVSSAAAGRDAAVLGAGVSARLADRLAGFASYDAELREGARAHVATAGLRYRW